MSSAASRRPAPPSSTRQGAPERSARAQARTASASTGGGRTRRRHRGDAAGFVPGRVGGRISVATRPRRGPGLGDRPGAVAGHRGRVARGPHPVRHGSRDALDVGGERRVMGDVIGRVLAHDVDDRRVGLLRVVQVGEPVAEAGAGVQQGGRRLPGHAAIAVRGAGHHALEQAQHAPHAVDAIQRRAEMHLRGAGIGEAGIDAARQQRPRQALGPVHGAGFSSRPGSGDSGTSRSATAASTRRRRARAPPGTAGCRCGHPGSGGDSRRRHGCR